MLNRTVKIDKLLEKNKVLIIYGPRQVGKTTLVKNFIAQYKGKYIFKTGDDLPFANLFAESSLQTLQNNVPEDTLLIIDEAHKIENIGRSLKLIVDNIQNVSLIVTGSSSFDLKNRAAESLTGRKKTVVLYPISVTESLQLYPKFDLIHKIKEFMVYGMYPEILLCKTLLDKREKITEIAHSYLLKDILDFDHIKDSKVIFNLLRLLAYQIGQTVSVTELAQNIGRDKNTVARYLDLLEKSFVIFNLGGFARNLRKEINKMHKYYFYDLGIRNAIISSFNDFDTRNDIGMLWENFLICERMKKNAYTKLPVNYYFWRTYDKKEIDLVEERGGNLYGYEFKWQQQNTKLPHEFLQTYKNSQFEVITQHNYFDYISYDYI